MVEAVSGPAQFRLRTLQSVSRFLGSESSGDLQGAPQSFGDLREAAEGVGLVCLLYLLCWKAGG
eukprot:9484254-Alexandrium_andersonii.AAC.1